MFKLPVLQKKTVISPIKKNHIKDKKRESDMDFIAAKGKYAKNEVVDAAEETPEQIANKLAAEKLQQGKANGMEAQDATFCGRIRFDFAIKEEVQVIICEECEEEAAVAKCIEHKGVGCNQVFCANCCFLCHPNSNIGRSVHEHIALGLIRPLVESDTSAVKKTTEFHLPASVFDAKEAMKQKDISLPNTLISSYDNDVKNRQSREEEEVAGVNGSALSFTDMKKKKEEIERNRNTAIFHPSETPNKAYPKYRTGQVLVFIDPSTGQEAYGRIVCEYDQRHGISAPTMIRGPNAPYYYVVEMINLLANVGGIVGLLELLDREVLPDDEVLTEEVVPPTAEERAAAEAKAIEDAKPPPSKFPVIEGVVNVEIREALNIARNLNQRLKAAKAIKIFGPRRHMLCYPYGTGISEGNSGITTDHNNNHDDGDDSSDMPDFTALAKNAGKSKIHLEALDFSAEDLQHEADRLLETIPKVSATQQMIDAQKAQRLHSANEAKAVQKQVLREAFHASKDETKFTYEPLWFSGIEYSRQATPIDVGPTNLMFPLIHKRQHTLFEPKEMYRDGTGLAVPNPNHDPSDHVNSPLHVHARDVLTPKFSQSSIHPSNRNYQPNSQPVAADFVAPRLSSPGVFLPNNRSALALAAGNLAVNSRVGMTTGSGHNSRSSSPSKGVRHHHPVIEEGGDRLTQQEHTQQRGSTSGTASPVHMVKRSVAFDNETKRAIFSRSSSMANIPITSYTLVEDDEEDEASATAAALDPSQYTMNARTDVLVKSGSVQDIFAPQVLPTPGQGHMVKRGDSLFGEMAVGNNNNTLPGSSSGRVGSAASTFRAPSAESGVTVHRTLTSSSVVVPIPHRVPPEEVKATLEEYNSLNSDENMHEYSRRNHPLYDIKPFSATGGSRLGSGARDGSGLPEGVSSVAGGNTPSVNINIARQLNQHSLPPPTLSRSNSTKGIGLMPDLGVHMPAPLIRSTSSMRMVPDAADGPGSGGVSPMRIATAQRLITPGAHTHTHTHATTSLNGSSTNTAANSRVNTGAYGRQDVSTRASRSGQGITVRGGDQEFKQLDMGLSDYESFERDPFCPYVSALGGMPGPALTQKELAASLAHTVQKVDYLPYNTELVIAQEERGYRSRHARSRKSSADPNKPQSIVDSLIQDTISPERSRPGSQQQHHVPGLHDLARQQAVGTASRGNTASSTAAHLNLVTYETNFNLNNLPLYQTEPPSRVMTGTSGSRPFTHYPDSYDMQAPSHRYGHFNGKLEVTRDKHEDHYVDHYGQPLHEDVPEIVRDTDVRTIVGSRTVGRKNADGTMNTSTLRESGATTGVLCFSNTAYTYNDKPTELANSKEQFFHSTLSRGNTSSPMKGKSRARKRDGTAFGHDNIQQRVLLPWQEQEIRDAHLSSNVATLRTYINTLCKTSEDVKALTKPKMYKMLQKILIIAEPDLCRPEDQRKLVLNYKFSFLKTFLDEKFFSIFRALTKWGFTTWRANMDHMRAQMWHYKAQTVQKYARRFLCRNELSRQYDIWEETLRQRHAAVHARFNRCAKDFPKAVTYDNVMFFKTHTDANRYADILRKTIKLVVNNCNSKINLVTKYYWERWKANSKTYVESGLTTGHFEHQVTDKPSIQQKDYTGFMQDVAALHDAYKHSVDMVAKVGARAAAKFNPVGDDDYGYNNIVNMPLNIKRVNIPLSPDAASGGGSSSTVEELALVTNSTTPGSAAVGARPGTKNSRPETQQPVSRPGTNIGANGRFSPGGSRLLENGEGGDGMSGGDSSKNELKGIPVPPYNAQDGIKLPRLPPIFHSESAQERLTISKVKRLEYMGFKATVEGPTDDCCWIIPGKLLMGKIPYGKAKPGSSLDAISAIFLSGVNLFVSLMSEKEEVEARTLYFGNLKKAEEALEAKIKKNASLNFHARATGAPLLLQTQVTKRDLLAEHEEEEEEKRRKEEEEDEALGMFGSKAAGAAAEGSLMAGLRATTPGIKSQGKTNSRASTAPAGHPYAIPSLMKSLFANAKHSVDVVIIDCRTTLSEQTEKLRNIPSFSKEDPRHLKAKREKIRCRARIAKAEETIKKTQTQLEKIPAQCEWTRHTLAVDSVPTIHEVLPILWTLEKAMAEGHCLYLYSKEGHGRIGMIAAMLLGRLYGLTTTETLYRVQSAHDCMTHEFVRKIPVQCPQLLLQRHLVDEVLTQSNRQYSGTIVRSHEDPDTQRFALQQVQRGTTAGFDHAPVLTHKPNLVFYGEERVAGAGTGAANKSVHDTSNRATLLAGPVVKPSTAGSLKEKIMRAQAGEPEEVDPRDLDLLQTQALVVNKQSLHLAAPIEDLLDEDLQAQRKVLLKEKTAKGYMPVGASSSRKSMARPSVASAHAAALEKRGRKMSHIQEGDENSASPAGSPKKIVMRKGVSSLSGLTSTDDSGGNNTGFQQEKNDYSTGSGATLLRRNVDQSVYKESMPIVQAADVLRAVPMSKFDPTEKPKIPLLRTRNECS